MLLQYCLHIPVGQENNKSLHFLNRKEILENCGVFLFTQQTFIEDLTYVRHFGL